MRPSEKMFGVTLYKHMSVFISTKLQIYSKFVQATRLTQLADKWQPWVALYDRLHLPHKLLHLTGDGEIMTQEEQGGDEVTPLHQLSQGSTCNTDGDS